MQWVYDECDPQEWAIVATCRDPLIRAVSCWLDKVHREVFYKRFERFPGLRHRMSFEEYTAALLEIPDEWSDPHFASQVHLTHLHGTMLPTHVMTVDRMQEDWRWLRDCLADRIDLPRRVFWCNQVGFRQPLDKGEKITAEAVRNVQARYAHDYEVFCYGVDSRGRDWEIRRGKLRECG